MAYRASGPVALLLTQGRLNLSIFQSSLDDLALSAPLLTPLNKLVQVDSPTFHATFVAANPYKPFIVHELDL